MKKILFTACILALTLQACKKGNIKSTIPTDTAEEVDTTYRAFLAVVKKEPKVNEAFVSNGKVLYVTVASDGTDRSGYAQYFCEVIRKNKADVVNVKIVEYSSMVRKDADNSYGKLLGEYRCEQ